jgi:hypothetical protein
MALREHTRKCITKERINAGTKWELQKVKCMPVALCKKGLI